jgi:hypothetical protein
MRIWIIALGVVAVLALAGGYWYGSWESDEVVVKQSADTASEGIKVHGDWEVTVSDPATGEEMVYAFENELHARGKNLLPFLLKGEGMVKTDDGSNIWEIIFWGTYPVQGQTETVSADTSLYQKDEDVEGYPNVIHNVKAFQLVGSFIVPPGWEEVTKVFTTLTFNLSSMSSINWDVGNPNINTSDYFTTKQFDNPIPVQPGQQVSVTVRISFE